MRECLQCGKPLPRRIEAGHRERQYCSDRCRQRACRARNKEKHNLNRIIHEASERLWSAVEQQVRRESWQDDLERKDKLLRQAHQELAYLEEQNSLLQQQIVFLENLLADKEAEIVRLNTLLEGQAKRKYR